MISDYSNAHKWNIVTLVKIGVKLESIKELVTSTMTDVTLSNEREKMKKELWQHQGESGKLVMDYLERKCKDL